MSDGGFSTHQTILKTKHIACSCWPEAFFFFFFFWDISISQITENADWLVWCMQSHKWHKINRFNGDSTHQCSQCAATAGSSPRRDAIKSRPGKNTIDLTQRIYSRNLLHEAIFLSVLTVHFVMWISGRSSVSPSLIGRSIFHGVSGYFPTTEILLQNKDDCFV